MARQVVPGSAPTVAAFAVAASVEYLPCEQLSRTDHGVKETKNNT